MRAIALALPAPVSHFNRMVAALIAAFSLTLMLMVSTAHAEEKKTETKTPATEAPAPDKASLLDIIEGDHVMGDPEAKVTIIEYASLSCPHCAHFHKDTFPELKKKYIDTGKVTFIFRNFPFNEPALRGAMLADCAGDAKYFTYLKVLFNSQENWAFGGDLKQNLRTIANVGGMSNEDFDKCMANKDLENRLIAGVSWASKELGVNSTPTFFINGEKVEAARDMDYLAPKIDGYLSK